MTKVTSNSSGRAMFWATLGPLLIVATLIISLVKAATPTLYIPIAALIGTPICLNWKMRGLLPAFGVLGVLLIVGSFQTGPEHRFWLVGMAMAVALSFVVTALSSEEAYQLLDQVQRDADSRLDHLWRLDEKLKNIQERWEYDRQDFNVRSKLLKEELEERQSAHQQLQQTSSLALQEINAQSEQNQKLLQELLQHQQENQRLKQELEERQEEVRLASGASEEAKLREQLHQLREQRREAIGDEELERELRKQRGLYDQLREQFEERKQVLHETRRELHDRETELELAHRRWEEMEKGGVRPTEWELLRKLEAKESEVEELEALVSELM